MDILLGFVIALAIALTGVGAGSMTTPLLILFLRVPPTIAVGTALTFGAIVKIISVPAYLWRRQVNPRVLGFMLLGGIPGVLGGSFLLSSLKGSGYEGWLYAILGTLIALTASFHLYRTLRPRRGSGQHDRSPLLPWLTLPIGAEVGFSSAGAGALGSIVLFGMTKLSAAEVVGTDLCFGLLVSAVGSAFHVSTGNYDSWLLVKLAAGGILGAITGSMLAGRIAPLPMRLAVLLMLVILGTQLAFHGQSAVLPHLQAVLR
ncbi:MAG TPA: sulfite exporter TauE/SafE family protein [Bryobacteraceae bacterium]|nr:sulfite exporter TauE/SafE family protein [Bryobacteraceae bacterium]